MGWESEFVKKAFQHCGGCGGPSVPSAKGLQREIFHLPPESPTSFLAYMHLIWLHAQGMGPEHHQVPAFL